MKAWSRHGAETFGGAEDSASVIVTPCNITKLVWLFAGLMLLVLPCSDAAAQSRSQGYQALLNENLESPFVSVAERVGPAVVSIATADRRFTVSGVGYAPEGGFALDGCALDVRDYPLLAELARAVLLCNDASLHEVEGQWTVEGDPMEGALLALARKAGLDHDQEAARFPRTDLVPFDSEHRFMAVLHHSQADVGAF